MVVWLSHTSDMIGQDGIGTSVAILLDETLGNALQPTDRERESGHIR
jgi:hypothetical protein